MSVRRGRIAPPAVLALMLALILASFILPAAVLGFSAPTFGTPSVTANLADPIVFTSQISGADIDSVDVLVRLAGNDANIVLPAQSTGSDTWQVSKTFDIASSADCTCVIDGPSAPNTRFEFQFEVHGHGGTVTLGPVADGVVDDNRFTWQTLVDNMVVVHWYAGDDAFAQGAGELANEAIDKASQLLGVTLPGKVDLFIYDTQQALLDAVSPNRESIAGEAHPDIQTMFVWLPHQDGISDFNAQVVRHELTHLVFDAATRNPYHEPPHWLNEGIAVYLSVGYSDDYKSSVDDGVANHDLIPLDGITDAFPAPQDEFYLAYGEAVGAVDFFVRTYGEQKLWDLVRSYAQGMTDDDAFTAATGADVAAFNAAWFASLGVDVPQPLGPQPAPTGYVPPDWTAGGVPAPTLAPGQTRAPGAPDQHGSSGAGADNITKIATLLLWLLVIVLLVGLVVYLVLARARGPRPPRAPKGQCWP